MAWARDPKGYERQLGELTAQFQYNYDVWWQSWVYSDWQQDGLCTALRDYKVRHISCDTLLPFACERGESCLLLSLLSLYKVKGQRSQHLLEHCLDETQEQQRFPISEVAADWHELMIPQRVVPPSIACFNGQLDLRCS